MNDMMIAFHLQNMFCFPPKLREGRGGVGCRDGGGVLWWYCLLEGDTRFKYR